MGRQRQQQRSDASVSQLLNALGHLLRHLFGLITLGLFMITAVALPLPAPLTIALIAWLFISWVIYLVKNQYKREGTR
jgi:MFS superfamily sulfate permease-like transporter